LAGTERVVLPDGTSVGSDAKDNLEDHLHRAVCAGTMSLGDAQRLNCGRLDRGVERGGAAVTWPGVRMSDNARSEAHYLAGAAALFPVGRRAWQAQRDLSEEAAAMAVRIAELDGYEEPPPDEPSRSMRASRSLRRTTSSRRDRRLTTRWNDGCRAYAIASNWVRTKVVLSQTRSEEP
jgi:hypothetical protein